MESLAKVLSAEVVSELRRLGYQATETGIEKYNGRVSWEGYFGEISIPLAFKVFIKGVDWDWKTHLVPIEEADDRIWGLNFNQQLGEADFKTYACSKERPYIVAGAASGDFVLFDTTDEHPEDPLVYTIDWDEFEYPQANSTRMRLSSLLKSMQRVEE